MKRIVTAITTFSLAFSLFGFPAMSIASDNSTVHPVSRLVATSGSTSTEQLPTTSTSGESLPVHLGAMNLESLDPSGGSISLKSANVGVVDISLSTENYLDRGTNLTATIKPSDSSSSLSAPLEMKFLEDSTSEYYARIENVPVGTSTLEISGEGYRTYQQQIDVDKGDRLVISLRDTLLNKQLYLGSEITNVDNTLDTGFDMGLIPYGDFTGDSLIDSKDSTALLNALVSSYGNEELADEAQRFDMDGFDGIDAIDVQLLAMSMQSTNKLSNIRKTKDTSNMVMDISNVTIVNSDDVEFTDIFIDNGKTIQFKPEDSHAAISKDNPVEFEIETPGDMNMAGMVVTVPTSEDASIPTEGSVIVELEDGESIIIPYKEASVTTNNLITGVMPLTLSTFSIRSVDGVSTKDNPGAYYSNGHITIDFGGQVAVKKVTISITKATSSNLVEIAQVEFLNGMEDKIPEPELNIPKNIVATPADKKFSLVWDQENNIEGYQVEVSNATSKGTFSAPRTKPQLSVENLGGKKLKNFTEYTVRIRSVQGDWYSPWSNPVKVTPSTNKKPAAPDSISVTGNFTDMVVSWKAAEDATSHVLYWKEKDATDWNGPTEIEVGTKYTVSGLKAGQSYEVKVAGKNVNGEGPARSGGATLKTASVKVPWYNLINRKAQSNTTGQEFDDPIKSLNPIGGSENDNDKNPDYKDDAIVDGDYSTYYLSKRNGSYPGGFYVEFDKAYNLDRIAVTTSLASGAANGVTGWYVTAWSEENPNGEDMSTSNGLVSAVSVNGTTNTIMLKFPARHITKIKVHMIKHVVGYPSITISELAFYEQPEFVSQVNGLWSDAQHTVLNDHVNAQLLDEAEAALNTPDPNTIWEGNPDGELHPDYTRLKREIDNARAVLAHQGLREPVIIDNSFLKSVNNFAGGTNAMQPLGISVKTGDQLSIFVGSNNSNDTTTYLNVYVGQQHPTYNAPFKRLQNAGINLELKPGINEVNVTQEFTSELCESGGSLYVEYNNANASAARTYSIRVEGGTKIPVLDIHGITNTEERVAKCKAYVDELESHVKELSSYHKENHTGSYDYPERYNAQKCTANMTDIGINYLLYSIPASQAWAGLRGSDNQEKAVNLEKTLSVGDDAMILYYQHKGLSNLAKAANDPTNYGSNNGLPKSRQNIRYTQMFTGAFMYAAGNHIGIQWGSTTGLIATTGVQTDENGKKIPGTSGTIFGWGVNHEIGHEINQGAYAIAEVTNNYYAQLAKGDDTDASTRWGDYVKVYQQVTSNTNKSPAGKTGIAIYWQLHLAYDGMDMMEKTGKPSYNYKTYDNYTDLFNNLFFARVDAYARNQSIAPKPGGVALTLNSGTGNRTDNNLIRLACAAAQKDLRDYFIAWGLVPDAVTDAYASQFPKETRAIQYVTDNTRTWQFDNWNGRTSNAPAAPNGVNINYEYGTNAVTIDLAGCSKSDEILGYEILRNGKAVGFVKNGTSSYTDYINTTNNRVFTYEVKVVDKWLNKSAATFAGKTKVHFENRLDKSRWSISSDLRESADEKVGSNDAVLDDPREEKDMDSISPASDISGCDPQPESESLGINKIIDGKGSTIFSGKVDGNNATLTIDFGGQVEMSALRYRSGEGVSNAISQYKIEISTDGTNWETIRTGSFNLKNGEALVYFDEGTQGEELYRVMMKYANYMRLTAVGQSTVDIAEIDVIGPEGDDLEILPENGIGILAADTIIGKNADGSDEIIPQGSFIVTGTYTGNPAYNVVILYDDDKLLYDSTRPQIDPVAGIDGAQFIFAPQLKEGELLPDVHDGYWVYYVTPDEMKTWSYGEGNYPKHVSAELYRVDDAMLKDTGQRQVANTMGVAVPSELPLITLANIGTVKQAALLNTLGIEEAVEIAREIVPPKDIKTIEEISGADVPSDAQAQDGDQSGDIKAVKENDQATKNDDDEDGDGDPVPPES